MTKEFLKEHIKKIKEMEELQSEINSLYITLRSPVITGMPGAHSAEPDKIGNVVAKIQEKEVRLIARLDALIEEEKGIEQDFEMLDPVERAVMRYRYIQGIEWEEICVKMRYSWQHIHRIHKNILEKLKDETK